MVFLHKNTHFSLPPVSSERRRELHLFEKRAGLRFHTLGLLNLAFSHRSYANEMEHAIDDNEKLEFLGDSVLGLVVSDYLVQRLRGKSEGELARIKSFVVSESSLVDVSRRLSVDNFILVGRGEEHSGGRSNKALLADAIEAIIGAYYLDSGFKAAAEFVRRLIVPEIDKVLEDRHRKDYKSLLQELVQTNLKTYPRYKVVHRTGPEHDKTFQIEVVVAKKAYGPGVGKNKKDAEQRAACVAYQNLCEEGWCRKAKGQITRQSGATSRGKAL